MALFSILQCRNRIWLAAAAATGLSACTTVSVPPQLEAVRQRVAADCAAGTFSGVVAVERQGRTIFLHSCGWADAEGRTPVDPAARFKLFSISKVFTGTTILRLVEAGRMELDGLLSSYVPGVPAPWAGVTIRQLLQHRSGIPDHTGKLVQAYLSGGHRSHSSAMQNVLASLNGQETELLAQPGEVWRYSNFGYELLALAAATRESRPFHEIVRTRLFEPAAMTMASMDLPDPDPANLRSLPTPGLIAGFNGSPGQRQIATSYSFIQQGAGAVIASYNDLFAFARALRSGRLLSREMRARNEADAITASATARYGYGWMIRSVGECSYWQHSGGNNGYVSEFAMAPDAEVTIVILSNLGFVHVSDYRQELAGILLGGPGCSPVSLGEVG